MADSAASRALRRLGKNLNGYFGERIQIESVLTDTVDAARRFGWRVHELPVPGEKPLLAFSRIPANGARLSVYISAGIHGDEPASPLAARRLLQENAWPEGLELRLLPCLNPVGFALNRRENRAGLDLNREYLNASAAETLAHIGWLEQQPRFDLALCLHEDWESNGFYVYELNPDNRPSLAESIVGAVAKVCPIDTSDVIEGRPAHGGIIRPSLDPRSRPQWPEAFYLITHKTRLSYTLEAPSDFPLACRVDALVAGAQAAVNRLGDLK